MSELNNRGQELAVEIRCEGHTDDAPIPKDKKTKYESNWELSSDRSLSVVKQMNKYASINYEYFSALGYGPYRPIISVETIKRKKTRREKDRLREYNRRVEIYLDAFARNKTKSNEEELIKSLSGKKRKKKEVEPVESS
jgi:chemotaxis protein MotB